jgi:serine protease SohB
MKIRKTHVLVLLLVVFLCCSVSCRAQEAEDSVETSEEAENSLATNEKDRNSLETSDTDEPVQKNPQEAENTLETTEEAANSVELSDDDELVQKNPDFVEPQKDETEDSDNNNDDDDDDEGDETDDEEDENIFQIKSVLAKALAQSRSLPRPALKFVKKNRLKLTIAAALFAFRKEIGRLALQLFTVPTSVDPKTGKVLTRTINIHPTAVLKIILFVDLMRKMQSGETTNAGPFGIGAEGSFMYKLLHPTNTAYVPPIEQHWTFERVNERYDKDKMALQKALTPGGTTLPRVSLTRNNDKQSASMTPDKDTVILLDWTKLTESLDNMDSLRDQVSFLLSQHRAKILQTPAPDVVSNAMTVNSTVTTTEIIVILDSPGGAASDYGLAAQLVLRLSHEPGMLVTVCVDKVAASGGYMMACASSPGRLYAAPFAVLGSIGVIGSTVNIHKTLEGWGITPLVFRGGKDKAPVGLIGEVTKDGIAKVQSMVDATHVAFKRHVVAARPCLTEKIEELATGNVWLGYEALDVGLVDRIITSDEYIGERILDGARVLRLARYNKPRFLFPSPHSRLSLSHTVKGIRTSLKAMVADFAQVLAQVSPSVNDVNCKLTPDYGLTTAAMSLGVSQSRTTSR